MHSETESVIAQESTFVGRHKMNQPVHSNTKNDEYAESMTLSYVRNFGSEAVSLANKSHIIKTEFTYRKSQEHQNDAESQQEQLSFTE